MARILLCDKCKKELKQGECFSGSIWGMNNYIDVDLCDECAKDMADYLGTTIKSENKPPIYGKESEE